MIFVIYRAAVFVVMVTITSGIIYYDRRGGYRDLPGWKYLLIGLVMITIGMAMGNLKFLVSGSFISPFNILQYFGLYFVGVVLIGYSMKLFVPHITEFMSILAEKNIWSKAKYSQSIFLNFRKAA